MLVSVCISAFDRPYFLDRCLHSLRRQEVDFGYEIVVCDDGSQGSAIRDCCNAYDVEKYIRLERPGWNCPTASWNSTFRAARGDVLVIQQSDVHHPRTDSLAKLAAVQPGESLIASVWEQSFHTGELGVPIMTPESGWWAFFLGSIHREPVYRVGGMDEDFIHGCHDDVWFSDCLQHAGITPVHRWDIVGFHHSHPRKKSPQISERKKASRRLLNAKRASNLWRTADAPWKMES